MAKRTEGYGHIAKYIGVFGGVQGLSILIGMVRGKLAAMLLGPVGMGLAAMFNYIVAFLAQATNLGISFSAVRHVSELHDSGDRQKLEHFVAVVRSWELLTGLVGMLLCAVGSRLFVSTAFTWGTFTLHFIVLSPVIFMMAVTGGETAILTGTRQLRKLAVLQVLSAAAGVTVAVPLYYLFGFSGIVPAIVLAAFAAMALTLSQSLRMFPLHIGGLKANLSEGASMVRLGVAFTLASVVGSASEMLVRAFLNLCSGLDEVGFYNTGYMLTVTYAGMVFSAMNTDYFPRLSSVSADARTANTVVNKQMEVSLLLLAPMLAAMMVLLPVLIPLLFTESFMPVLTMTQLSVMAMYFKVVTMPVAYITLARGRSMAFLLLETAYYVAFVTLVALGYWQWGLTGAGVAILLAHVFDLVMIWTFASVYYGYRPTRMVVNYAVAHTAIGFAVLAVCLLSSGWLYWTTGAALVVASTALSLNILRSKTHLWDALLRRYRLRT